MTKRAPLFPTVDGRRLLVQGVPNDRTRLYWRSSIGLPMQQLKPGGGGGGWTCTANRKSTLWGCAKCCSKASRLRQTSMICEWFEARSQLTTRKLSNPGSDWLASRYLNRAAYAICSKSLPFWTTGRTSKWVISNIGPLNDGL